MDRASRFDMLKEMLLKEPDDVFLNYAMGIELEKEEKFDEAEQQYLKALEINREYLPCFYRLGQLAEQFKGREDAIEYYKQGAEYAKKQGDRKTEGEMNEAIFLLED